jgi:glutamyl-tRNA reductase
MVLGAGEMAELAIEALRKRGLNQITVVNRTVESARSLAHRWDGQAASLEALIDLLPSTDIIITSTGAPHTIVSPTMVEKAMENRPDRPMVFMDIAVPRDVDQGVANVPGVRLFDVDILSNHLEVALSKREAEVPKVEAVLMEEQAEFMEYIASLEVVPIIIEMRQQADAIRQAELQKTIRRIPGLSPDDQQRIEELTKSIVKKILHSPTVRLQDAANGPNAADYANVVRGLFGLN